MQEALRQSAVSSEYKRIVAHILQAIKTRLKKDSVWCVVEGPEDRKVYRKLFKREVNVEIAAIKSLTNPDVEINGCEAVEKVVAGMLNTNTTQYIFGIRDTDYTCFTGTYQCPQNIFLTDGRDLEMMLIKSQEVRNALAALATRVPDTLDKACTITREIGYVRIFNDCNRQYGYAVNDIHRCDRLWDQRSNNFCAGYATYVWDAYNEQGAQRIQKSSLTTLIRQKQLTSKPNEDICQGHDTMRMFIYICSSGAKDFEYQVESAWYNHYPMSDFMQTSLYGDISGWANRKGVIVL